MRNTHKACLAAILMATSVCSYAAKWSCTTTDSRGHSFTAISSTAQAAMKQSFKSCMKLSRYKASCNMSASNCHRVHY